MRSVLAKLGQRVRRHWRLLLVVAGLAGASVLAWPHLMAWNHWRAGQSALERYRDADALKHLEACLETWPTSAKAHLLAARATRRIGDLQAALKHLGEYERLQPDLASEATLERALVRAVGGELASVDDYLLTRAEKEPAFAPLIW